MNIMLGFIISTILMILIYGYTDNTIISIVGSITIFVLVNILFYKWGVRKVEKVRKVNLTGISRMSGIQFEEYLFTILRLHNYKVRRTSKTGDFGADLILTDKDTNQKIVVQAKRYKSSVGIKAVQEVLGARSYYEADSAWVITNSYYTKAAKQLAEKSNVVLIDKNSLIDMAFNLGIYLDEKPKNHVPAEAIQPVAVNDVASFEFKTSTNTTTNKLANKVYCNECGDEMVIRKGSKGKFYGCISFPKCRGTKNI